MKKLNLKDVSQYVEQNIGTFHQKRIQSLDKLKLSKVLKRKNPYLFRAKYVLTADQLIRGIVDAHISSNEEAIFGDWLEGLAIFVIGKVYSGRKSGITGIDFEFDKNKIRYIVAVKSGPNWANSRQLAEMKTSFKTAIKTLRTSNSNLQVVAVNGCCYGCDNKPDKGDYYKFCGQTFWEFISGNINLFTEIVEPLGFKAKEKNDDFLKSYSKMLNKFTKEFTNEYCKNNGEIDWDKLVRFNSGAKK
ncbi:MAG: cytosolic protein [Ignavibacteria bacterium]|nr:cytosolic protein [Ignavibacteria bacterium]